jgi:PIN domain nuclease of toxin-antitoxin system
VRLLLDTCTFLWMLGAEEKLSAAARVLLLDPANDLFLSAASSWEIAIKCGLGRLRLDESPESYVPARMRRHGIRGLPVDHVHALRTFRLPRHHSDPFDRILVSQAQEEGLVVLTPDAAFAPYEVETSW